jgi:hypothetical protein
MSFRGLGAIPLDDVLRASACSHAFTCFYDKWGTAGRDLRPATDSLSGLDLCHRARFVERNGNDFRSVHLDLKSKLNWDYIHTKQLKVLDSMWCVYQINNAPKDEAAAMELHAAANGVDLRHGRSLLVSWDFSENPPRDRKEFNKQLGAFASPLQVAAFATPDKWESADFGRINSRPGGGYTEKDKAFFANYYNMLQDTPGDTALFFFDFDVPGSIV